jgi:hypothetical protein
MYALTRRVFFFFVDTSFRNGMSKVQGCQGRHIRNRVYSIYELCAETIKATMSGPPEVMMAHAIVS